MTAGIIGMALRDGAHASAHRLSLPRYSKTSWGTPPPTRRAAPSPTSINAVLASWGEEKEERKGRMSLPLSPSSRSTSPTSAPSTLTLWVVVSESEEPAAAAAVPRYPLSLSASLCMKII